MSCIFLCSLTYQVVVFQASLWSQRGWEGLVPGSAHKGGDTGNGLKYDDTFKLGAKMTEDERGQAGRAVGGIRPGEQVLICSPVLVPCRSSALSAGSSSSQ